MSGEMVGEALVPYYKQILLVLNMYKNMNSESQTCKWLSVNLWTDGVASCQCESLCKPGPLCYNSLFSTVNISEFENRQIFIRHTVCETLRDVDVRFVPSAVVLVLLSRRTRRALGKCLTQIYCDFPKVSCLLPV